MIGKLNQFFEKEPEIIIEWQDEYTPARGWLVMNSLRGGAAGGGTRMKKDCTKKEVVDLAKTMEIKFTISGPAIGGAKSGIDYDFKSEQDKREVLRRWFKFIKGELSARYGTGGDQNVNQTTDVIPLLAELGIRNPQEGIVRGHYHWLAREKQEKIIDQLRTGVSLPILKDAFLHSLNYTIADVATGYGVVKALSLYYNNAGNTLKGKRVLVEGLGNVGGAAAYYAWREGAKVVGIIEKNWSLLNDQGIDLPILYRDFRAGIKSGKSGVINIEKELLTELSGADVFIPAATSATINAKRTDALQRIGIAVLSCGANNPFADEETARRADEIFSVLPDFVANSGMARVFAYLMQPDCQVTEEAILADIARHMKETFKNIFFRQASPRGIISAAEEAVWERLNEFSGAVAESR